MADKTIEQQCWEKISEIVANNGEPRDAFLIYGYSPDLIASVIEENNKILSELSVAENIDDVSSEKLDVSDVVSAYINKYKT